MLRIIRGIPVRLIRHQSCSSETQDKVDPAFSKTVLRHPPHVPSCYIVFVPDLHQTLTASTAHSRHKRRGI